MSRALRIRAAMGFITKCATLRCLWREAKSSAFGVEAKKIGQCGKRDIGDNVDVIGKAAFTICRGRDGAGNEVTYARRFQRTNNVTEQLRLIHSRFSEPSLASPAPRSTLGGRRRLECVSSAARTGTSDWLSAADRQCSSFDKHRPSRRPS